MLRMIFSLPIFLTSAAIAFSEIPDSSKNALNLDSMSRRLDSLEASLIKLKIAKEDHSIYAIGDALNWGKGFGLGLQLSDPGFGMELNYTFKALGFSTPYYLGNFRCVAIAAGFEHWINGNPFLKGSPDTSFSKVVAPYIAMRLNTPVLLNFTSFSTSARMFWSKIDATPVPGWGISEEIQFWLTKAGHFNIGFHLEEDRRLNTHITKEWVFRPYMGFSGTFGKKGDLRMRPV